MKIESISIELSSMCNLKCPLCARNHSKHDAFLITPEEFKNLKLYEVDSVKQIQLGGSIGDPITSPYLFDIGDIIKKCDKRVLISTNGSFRNENWWYELPKHLPKDHSVRFAIDGTDNETLNIYRKGANYNKILNNASAFIDGGGNAIWQMIMFKHNEHQFDEAQKISNKMGFKNCLFVPSTYYTNEYQKPNNIISDLEYSKSKKNTDNKCRIQLGRIAISSRGIYLPCCFCYNDETVYEISNEPIKHINDFSLLELIEDGYYQRILNRVLKYHIDVCSNCVSYCGQRLYGVDDL
jgi:MoaA/NifB/PqqE/SkfB family radical SAM enzyme